MADLGFTVNESELPEDSNSFDPLPAGKYDVTITGADIRMTKSGTGKYISLELEVNGPTHVGRRVWSNLNIQNDSQKAEEIGRQQLGSIMRAVNLPALQDTDQLIGGALGVKLSVRKSEEYGDGNEVKAYFANGGAATSPAPAAQPAAAKAPWAR